MGQTVVFFSVSGKKFNFFFGKPKKNKEIV